MRFTQYVFRMRRVAVTVVLDDPGQRVLLIRRHRFIVGRWVWELPDGYVDDGENQAAAAARELQEETGWRPRAVELVLSSQGAGHGGTCTATFPRYAAAQGKVIWPTRDQVTSIWFAGL